MKIKSTKLLAILLAVCMMFSFSSVVFAANLGAVGGSDVSSLYETFLSLKNSEKIGLLDDVYEALEKKELVGVNNAALEAFDKYYTEIKKVEQVVNNDGKDIETYVGFENLFNEEKVKEVYTGTLDDIDSNATVEVKDLTGVVADAVIESDAIKPEQTVDLVEKVMENIGGAEVGGVTIPEKLLKIYDKVATYLDDEGKLALMKQVTKLLDENVSYPEVAKEIYAILSASEKFTLGAIVDIVEYVFTDVYNEEISKIYADAYDRAQNAGLIEKAVTALELAYSKLDKVATVVKGIVTNQEELQKALLDEIDVAKVSFKKVIDLLNDANSSFNDVLGLRDELKAHLDVVKNLSYELSKEDLGKLIDDVHDLYFDALVGTRIKYKICGGTVNYVALGGTLSVNTKYAGAFETELAKKLPAGIYNGKVEMIPDTLQTSVNANTVAGYIANPDVKAKIEDANLITFNMDAVDALVNLVSLGDDLGWADYADPETIALAEKAVAKLEVLLAKKFDADKIAEVEKFAEKLAYTVVSYGVESYKALETIVELNPNAKIIVLGMVNPFADVSVKYDVNEETISLYDLFDFVIEATDIYNGIYAMFSENVTFVSVADAEKEYDYADITIDITAGDDISDLSEVITRNLDSTNYADAFALKKTNIVNALLTAIDFVGIKHIDEKPVDNKCDRCGAPLSTPNPFVPSGPSAPVHFNCDGGENCYCNKYTDLDNTMWYHQGVCYMIEHGYMIGIGDGKWAPEQIITRAEIATILWRIAGSEEVDYALDFSDVEADMWYTEAIEWAVSEEIFLGYGDGKFGPNDQITREQLVLVMYRYELDNGKKLTADFDMTTVSDADEISDWALEAMTWALDCGLIIGTDVDVLTASPLKTATRAEVAMIFYRKLDNLLK